MDTDNDGRITLEEFRKFLTKFLPAAELPSDQLIKEMFRAADKDGSGTITLDGRGSKFLNFSTNGIFILEVHAIMEI